MYLERFEDAIDYMEAHRNVQPAIYSNRRLKEMPKPSLGAHNNCFERFCASNDIQDSSEEENNESIEADVEANNHDAEADTDINASVPNGSENAINSHESTVNNDSIDTDDIEAEISTSSLHESQIEQIPIEEVINTTQDVSVNSDNTSSNDIDPLALDSNATIPRANADVGTSDQIVVEATNACDAEPLVEQSTHENVVDSSIDPLINVQVKAEKVPLYEIHTRNNEEINELLDEPVEIYCDNDDELTMIISKDGLPKPFAATEDDMIKRENDPISGNIAFNEEVNALNLG